MTKQELADAIAARGGVLPRHISKCKGPELTALLESLPIPMPQEPVETTEHEDPIIPALFDAFLTEGEVEVQAEIDLPLELEIVGGTAFEKIPSRPKYSHGDGSRQQIKARKRQARKAAKAQRRLAG